MFCITIYFFSRSREKYAAGDLHYWFSANPNVIVGGLALVAVLWKW